MNIEKLSPNGQMFLANAKTILDTPLKFGIKGRYDDEITNPVVKLESILDFSERAKKYGIQGLSRESSTGELSQQGYPIPNDDYLAKVPKMYPNMPKDIRNIMLSDFKNNGNSIEYAINLAGDEVQRMVTKGDFVIYTGAKPS